MLIPKVKIGLEKESLRVLKNGSLSHKKHPIKLGAPLTNQFITTDFSESQLELITPPCDNKNEALLWLKTITQYVYKNIEDELLWPLSSPFGISDNPPPIANYGSSQEALEKVIYRKGLSKRYGVTKQLFCGIHINFSLDDDFWESYRKEKSSPLSLKDFKSEQYLHIIRNYIRHAWVIPYFFGATPKSDISCNQTTHDYATSLRMSTCGYINEIQQNIFPSYNTLEGYIKGIRKATSTEYSPYKYIEEQLNTSLLQSDKEHYLFIRPKSSSIAKGENVDNLEKGGIDYLEVRSLDINPFLPLGVDANTIEFVQKFLLMCLFEESPTMTHEEFSCHMQNHAKVCFEGRKPNLELKCKGEKKLLSLWIESFRKTLNISPPKPISEKLTKMMEEEGISLYELGMKYALLHSQTLLNEDISPSHSNEVSLECALSCIKWQELEGTETYPIPLLEDLEISTQILLRAALKRGCKISLLDRAENFIQLEKEGHIEYIKQATKTRLNSEIVTLIKKNKAVTKSLLMKHGIKVPSGKHYIHYKDALNDFSYWMDKKSAIKPTSTNMGDGIAILDSPTKKEFEKALLTAFTKSTSILIENYIPGEEYRLFVIDDKVIAVTNRKPAHVIGNGVDTVDTLIEIKNRSKKLHEQIKRNETPSSYVPQDGELFLLKEISNVSLGGDAIDVTDKIESSYKKLAVQSAQAVASKICGVDMIIQNCHARANGDNYVVLELNHNPMLAMHTLPTQGKSRPVAEAVLEILGL